MTSYEIHASLTGLYAAADLWNFQHPEQLGLEDTIRSSGSSVRDSGSPHLVCPGIATLVGEQGEVCTRFLYI